MVPTKESLKAGRRTYRIEGLMVFTANVEVFTLWSAGTSAPPRPMEMIVINLSNLQWEKKNYLKNIKWENHPEKNKSCWTLILKTLIFHMSRSSQKRKMGELLEKTETPEPNQHGAKDRETRGEREMVARKNREQLPLPELEKILYPSFSIRVSCSGL